MARFRIAYYEYRGYEIRVRGIDANDPMDWPMGKFAIKILALEEEAIAGQNFYYATPDVLGAGHETVEAAVEFAKTKIDQIEEKAKELEEIGWKVIVNKLREPTF